MRILVRWGLSIAALLLAAIVWAQGLVICGKCGREAAPGDLVCTHCQARLPKPAAKAEPEAAPAAPTTGDATEGVAAEAATAIEECVRQARELQATQPAVALCYYQNAMALIRLTPAGHLPPTAEKIILDGNKRLLELLQQGSIACRNCGGTGHYQLDTSKVTGRAGLVTAKGMACKSCQGSGRVPGPRPIEEFKQLVLKGRAEFERRQVVAGNVRVGRALVPAALEQKLNNTQRALVMTGMPSPCGECQFSGRQACNKCRGTGWEKCTNPDCRNGVLESRSSVRRRRETRMNEDAIERCPRCNGLGEVACAICRGAGSTVCARCSGSGLARECARCSASGIIVCARCKGAGELRGAQCAECKGEKVILCSTCRGEGVLAR